MLIEFRKIEEKPLEFDINIEPSEIDLTSRFSQLREAANFVGKIKKEDWFTRVSGESETSIDRKCDRCLEKGRIDVAVAVDCAYVKYNALSEDRETEMDILGLDYSVIDKNQIDLKQVFTEHLLLSIPDSFLCTDDCPGLCPECGAGLKDGSCNCKNKKVDPRWAALRKIKEDLD